MHLGIWFTGSILGFNLRIKVFPNYGFEQEKNKPSEYIV